VVGLPKIESGVPEGSEIVKPGGRLPDEIEYWYTPVPPEAEQENWLMYWPVETVADCPEQFIDNDGALDNGMPENAFTALSGTGVEVSETCKT
jgi:hypothetical protein